MSFDFSKLSAEEARQLIALTPEPFALTTPITRVVASQQSITSRRTLAQTIRDFIAGDHWQNGNGWIGPRPIDPNTNLLDDSLWAMIEARFVSRNVLAEIADRHRDGVVGREPKWGFTVTRALAVDEQPTTQEQTLIDDVEAAVTIWWNNRRAHLALQRAIPEALGSRRAVLRLYVPVSALTPEFEPAVVVAQPVSSATTTTTPAVSGAVAQQTPPAPQSAPAPQKATGRMLLTAATFAEALDKIYIDVVNGDDGTVFTDVQSMDQCGVVSYELSGGTPTAARKPVVELSFLDGDQSTPLADRETVLRVIEIQAGEQDVRFALGGRLTHHAIEVPQLITEQLVSQQKSLNLAITMLPRNVETGGFLERLVMNAQMPGEWEVDAHGKRTGRFNRGTFVTGAGVTTFIQGVETTDAAGNETLTTPSVQFREPSPVTPTVEAITAIVENMIAEAKQAHIFGSDKVMSGISRVQARADFGKSLQRTKASVDSAGVWLLETVVAWALAFTAAPAEFANASIDLRANFSAIIDTGPLDPVEKAALSQAVSAGQLSIEAGMEALGVEDVDAELARLNGEPGHRVELRTKKAVALKAFTDAGLSVALAAQLAGFEDDEIKEIEKDALNNPTPGTAVPMIPQLDANGQPVLDANGQPVMIPDPNAPVPPPVVPGQAAPILDAQGNPMPGMPVVPNVRPKGVIPPALAPFVHAARAHAGKPPTATPVGG